MGQSGVEEEQGKCGAAAGWGWAAGEGPGPLAGAAGSIFPQEFPQDSQEEAPGTPGTLGTPAPGVPLFPLISPPVQLLISTSVDFCLFFFSLLSIFPISLSAFYLYILILLVETASSAGTVLQTRSSSGGVSGISRLGGDGSSQLQFICCCSLLIVTAEKRGFMFPVMES